MKACTANCHANHSLTFHLLTIIGTGIANDYKHDQQHALFEPHLFLALSSRNQNHAIQSSRIDHPIDFSLDRFHVEHH